MIKYLNYCIIINYIFKFGKYVKLSVEVNHE
jgi:hypothetical protein